MVNLTGQLAWGIPSHIPVTITRFKSPHPPSVYVGSAVLKSSFRECSASPVSTNPSPKALPVFHSFFFFF